MATRVFCDLCGNTVREPAVYVFGCRHPANHASLQAKQNAAAMAQYQAALAQQQLIYSQQPTTILGGSGTGGLGGYAVGNPNTSSLLKEVDLCPHCEKIWMDRVINITKASEPPDVLSK